MGFVDDESDSEAENALLDDYASDEEAAIGKESSPFLLPRRQRAHRHSSPNDPRTPTTKDNGLLANTRLRRPGITENEEIWEELEEEGGDQMGKFLPVSPHHRRRISSARTTPAASNRNSKILFDDNEDYGLPTETTGLLARSSTGRSYRDKRRRRSAPMLENQLQSRRRSEGGQEALGGWWKMKWWNGGDFKGKGRKDHDKNGSGDGNGNENGSGRGERREGA